jgi:hypothetical protein
VPEQALDDDEDVIAVLLPDDLVLRGGVPDDDRLRLDIRRPLLPERRRGAVDQ